MAQNIAENYKCGDCGYETSNIFHLRKHEASCVKDCTEEFERNFYNYTATTKLDLSIHDAENHLDKELFECENCNFKTTKKRELRKHNFIHIREEMKCSYCDYKTSVISSLKFHEAIHTDNRKYRCDQCEYRAIHIGNLQAHKAAKHAPKTEYKCSHCDYVTSLKYRHEKHESSHFTLKNVPYFPYKSCDNNKASSKLQQENHERSQICGKDFDSDHCDYTTTTESLLKMHEAASHADGEIIKCQDCDFVTTTKLNLKKHRFIHAGEKFKCNNCKYETQNKLLLELHKVININDKEFKGNFSGGIDQAMSAIEREFKCYICDYRCASKSELKVHQESDHPIEKELPCKSCDPEAQVESITLEKQHSME